MIEKHYGKYLRGDLGEQFSRLLGAKTETFTETLAEATGTDGDEVLENSSGSLLRLRRNNPQVIVIQGD